MTAKPESVLRTITIDEAEAILFGAGLVQANPGARRRTWDKLKADAARDSLCGPFVQAFSKRLFVYWLQEFEKGRLPELEGRLRTWMKQNKVDPTLSKGDARAALEDGIRTRSGLKRREVEEGVSRLPDLAVHSFFNVVVLGWVGASPDREETLLDIARDVVALSSPSGVKSSPGQAAKAQMTAETPMKTPEAPKILEPSSKRVHDKTASSPTCKPEPGLPSSAKREPSGAEATPTGIAEQTDEKTESSGAPAELPVADVGEDEDQRVKTPAPPVPTPAPLWKYLRIPDDPDKHTEYDVRTGTSPEGMLILGARVRGKKHKHEGTNCDDWFEFAVAGTWSIFAVADGGGSYKFSRVGAKAACQGAVSYLAETLGEMAIKPRKVLTADIMKDEDLKAANVAIHEGIRRGWSGVEQALHERENSKAHYKTLEHRDLTLRDLYTTLLVGIHTTFETPEGNRSLILSCAAGDGMVAAINRDGDCNLLMKPDSGEFSGEVEFLGPKLLTDASLPARTFPFAGGLKAMMLMTDGVADDYFPNSPRMIELYADLVLNGILPAGSVPEERIVSDLAGTKFPDMASLREVDFLVECERLSEKTEKVKLASAAKYAEALGVQTHDLARRPGLLAAGLEVSNGPMPGAADRGERMILWLDSYQVKGSFDDRTLVVLSGGGTK